jgi:hypothetical protein
MGNCPCLGSSYWAAECSKAAHTQAMLTQVAVENCVEDLEMVGHRG